MMTLSQAMEMFERSKWMSIHQHAAALVLDFSSCVEARVRRKKNETFEQMLIRCAEKAQARKVAGWKHPAVHCGACGVQSWNMHPVPQIGLRLCKECALGVGDLVQDKPASDK